MKMDETKKCYFIVHEIFDRISFVKSFDFPLGPLEIGFTKK
jgi:hypothetical protein